MPTYVYECAKCGDEFELWQSFAEDPLKKHPECGGKVTKVLQPVGIVLKGSGFYKNDSRSGNKNGRAKKSESASDGSKSDGSKSDGSKSDSSKSGDSSSSSTSDSSSSSAKTEKKVSTPANKSS
jgi:putative FmdB family regulatory protein